MKTIQTKWTVLPDGCNDLFAEEATHVEVREEGAGMFIVISQCGHESQEIRIDIDEWPAISDTVGLAFKELKRLEEGAE